MVHPDRFELATPDPKIEGDGPGDKTHFFAGLPTASIRSHRPASG